MIAFDFTIDGQLNPLPLSASAIILDSEAYAHDGASDTMCFMDPNQPGFNPISQSRSCQSEQQLDPQFSNYRPVHPFRTHVNIGRSTTAGNPYGEIWIGAFTNPNVAIPGDTIYFNLSYRGYVEPERQLVSQLPIP